MHVKKLHKFERLLSARGVKALADASAKNTSFFDVLPANKFYKINLNIILLEGLHIKMRITRASQKN